MGNLAGGFTMLKSRILRLEARAPRAPRPLWALITRETSDPFEARAALRERMHSSSFTAAEAAELARLGRVIANYEADMAL